MAKAMKGEYFEHHVNACLKPLSTHFTLTIVIGVDKQFPVDVDKSVIFKLIFAIV